jgi:uncharacterized LabA/DUF88 family protein
MSKIVALIDGVSLYGTSKALGFDVDYKRLLEWLHDEGDLLRASYYTTVDETGDYSSIRPLLDWLEYNGFSLITKPVKVREEGRRKGSMHVELSVDAMELANSGSIGHVFLFPGDGEYVALARALKRKGIRVTVVSTLQTNPAFIDDALRRTADEFIDLDAIKEDIRRV